MASNGMLRMAGIALALALAACGGERGPQGDGLSGTINGDGSSTVFPITEAVAEEFQAINPTVEVTVGVSGTGGGFEKFCAGETDIQDASRPIKEEDPETADDEEATICADAGIEYVELTVAADGLAVVANPENDWVDCLTTDELMTIWEPDSEVDSWADVRDGFPDEKLELFGPGTDSGTFDYFTDLINGEEGASRSDYTQSEDDNVLVQGVAGEKGGLGYFGFAYFQENADRLKLVGIDGGNGCVRPSDATVQDGTYAPLSRPLFLYVKTSAIARPEVTAFIEFYMDNVSDLLADVGYTPLSDADLQVEIDEWQQAAG